MAVISCNSHVNRFSQQTQILSNRVMIDQGEKNVYVNDVRFAYGMAPMYPFPSMESGLTNVPRKRSHDTIQTGHFVNQNVFNNENESFTFLGNDISMQIYQQQLDIDRFIAHHTEKVKFEIESKRRTNSIRLMMAAEEQISKKLRSKDNEIVKICKMNYALEEKVKSLNVENQIWKQMAETNEATANALRSNLQSILTEMQQQQQQQQQYQNDDVESCCESNNNIGNINGHRLCKICGKKESCVLLLPCRHLCICNVCESAISLCPICKSVKNAIVQVNMT